jgi:hypothetical protein
MAIVRLALTKPINTSLQAKASDVNASTSNVDNGAWDIVYFTRIENGKQVGDIERLGKCVNIETAAGDYFSEELARNGDFSTNSDWNLFGTSTIAGGKLNSSGVNPYLWIFNQGNTSIVTGKIYKVTYTISNYSAGKFAFRIWNGDGTANSANGTYTEYITAGVDASSLIGGLAWSGNSFVGSIDNLTVIEVVTVSSNQYLVDVEVDSTAQTPNDGDFIFFGKENKVNISGVRGYFAEVEMRNDSTDSAKLFSVGSEMTQSSK